jgi:hypothetical protein
MRIIPSWLVSEHRTLIVPSLRDQSNIRDFFQNKDRYAQEVLVGPTTTHESFDHSWSEFVELYGIDGSTTPEMLQDQDRSMYNFLIQAFKEYSL